MSYKILSANEAVAIIRHGETIGMSGFSPAGTPKACVRALAEKAKAEHARGNDFKVNVFSVATVVDDALAEADAVAFRTPYQTASILRKKINSQQTRFADYHLSRFAQMLRHHFLPSINVAIVEVVDVSDDGELIFTTSSGASADFCLMAEKIIVERNHYHRPELRYLHDIYIPADPPHRLPIPLTNPRERIGTQTLKVDPAKIVGIVENDECDHIAAFKASDEVTDKIGENICNFLVKEFKAGRIPKEFLPLQSGVGNVANAVLAGLGRNPDVPAFQMFTEVIQDAVIDLIDSGRCTFASTCALTLSDECLKRVYENFDFYRDKIVLRPQEITNSPELARRLGMICMNTAIEFDLFGHVNSSHFYGRQMMNGIGGSGDFSRNAYLTIFSCPSCAKNGAISSVVPMCSHIDHIEHDVDVLVTEFGVADLRGLSPRERAEVIIENCAHPEYRQILRDYLALTPGFHTPCSVAHALDFHKAFLETGDMRNVKF